MAALRPRLVQLVFPASTTRSVVAWRSHAERGNENENTRCVQVAKIANSDSELNKAVTRELAGDGLAFENLAAAHGSNIVVAVAGKIFEIPGGRSAGERVAES